MTSFIFSTRSGSNGRCLPGIQARVSWLGESLSITPSGWPVSCSKPHRRHFADNAALNEFAQTVVSGLEDPISTDVIRSFVSRTSSDNVAPELLDQLIDEVLKVPARVWKQTFASVLEYDDIADLPRIDAPTLLVWGEDDALVSREMQDQLVSCIPSAKLVVYSGVGHTPRWDDPSRFSNDVADFVIETLRTPD